MGDAQYKDTDFSWQFLKLPQRKEEMRTLDLEGAAILYLQGSQDSGATPEVTPDTSRAPSPALGSPSLHSAAVGTPPATVSAGAPPVGVG